MKTSETFAIAFGQEELLYLLRSLGLPDLPGMGEKPWGEITRENSVFVLDAVGRSLFGRGVVSFNAQGGIETDKTIRAILTASAYAKQIILLTYAGQDGQAHQINYYRVPEFDVCQKLIMPWLYQFELQMQMDMGYQLITGCIAPVKGEFSTPVIQLRQDALDKAREMAPDDTSSAIDILFQAGFEKSSAQKFVGALVSPLLSLRFQSVDATDDPVKRNIFSLLAGQDSCWLLIADDADGMVSLKAISTPELERIISVAYLPFRDYRTAKTE